MFAKVKGMIHHVMPGDHTADGQKESAMCAPGFWELVPLELYRQRQGTDFNKVPMEQFRGTVNAMDHILSASCARSPGNVEGKQGWYMHANQQDNMLVLAGVRTTTLRRTFVREDGKRCAEGVDKQEVFQMTPNEVRRNGVVVHQGPVILRIENNVLHRIESGTDGSSAVNFAVRTKRFDIDHEYDIFDCDESGLLTVIRQGKEDQYIVREEEKQNVTPETKHADEEPVEEIAQEE